jgi:hypothetical protein
VNGAFAALVDAVKAAQIGDAARLRASLVAAPAENFFSKAVAHRCAGIIFAAMARHKLRDGDTLLLWRMLQGYAGNCALAGERMRGQIAGLVDAFSQSRVPHALLKGAARLRAGEPGAQWTHMDDIDVLIPCECGEDAVRALQAHGYRFECSPRVQAEYKTLHHHLAPLVPSDGGKSVELHVHLEYPPWFSTRTDWSLLAEHLVPQDGVPSAFVLDGFARALHAAIHGVGLYRLGDVAILAAELRRTPSLLQPLEAWIARERKQRVALRAVLVFAARLADVPVTSDRSVERHLAWVKWREDAPPVFHRRMQVLDAYFSNTISLAIPNADIRGLERTRTMCVRFGAALAATGYRAFSAR